MKKLLLILSAVFVSVMAWAQAQKNPDTGWDYLNPYAYDLKSSLSANGDTLILTYAFNAPSFNWEEQYDKLNPQDGTGTGRGIQIYLLYKNEQGEWQRVQKDDGTGDYGIYSGGYNKAQTWTVKVPIIDIPDNCKGKELTWEAVVHGNVGRTKPKIVGSVSNKPKNAYGIAINNCESHSRFAQMFVSEAFPSKREGWNYWKDKWEKQSEYEYANTMLEYTPLLGFQCAHHKHYHNGRELSHFASAWQKVNSYTYSTSYNYEPNRVKISDDGRMFVSSFHPHANCVVLEYKSAYSYYNVIDNVWQNNIGDGDDKKPLFYKRCIGMDVKGSGENLQIVLCWIDANAIMYKHSNGTNYYKARIELWEYDLGKAEHDGYINSSRLYLSPFDTSCGYVRKIGTYDDWDYIGGDAKGGLLYQGFYNEYNNASRGNVDVAYGTNNDVWVKIDYAFWKSSPAKIIRVNLSSPTVPTIKTVEVERSDAYYGGSGIFIQDNMLFTGTGGNAIHVYEINSSTGELVTNDNGSLKPKSDWKLIDERIGRWVTGFSSDHAGNLYVTTEDMTATTSTNSYTANVLAIAMPYKTSITTRARNTFTIYEPIPNILATELKYEPVPGKDAYTFSFVTNTKPTIAEIRFYKKDNIEKMNSNIEVIHADNYKKSADDGTVEPDYVYRFSNDQLNRGLMSVTLDMVGGAANNKEITNALPPGELYWSVYVETTKSSSFAPIYRSGFPDKSKYQLMHATVNNYPETDMFGSLIVTNNPEYGELRSKTGLLVYRLNEDGGDGNEKNYNNNTRYVKVAEYLNGNKNSDNKTRNFLNYPRRMAVAPDGRVYIADEGRDGGAGKTDVVVHTHGGIKVWDPSTGEVSDFSTNILGTSTGLALYQNGDEWKLYAANTYQEFYLLGDTYDGSEKTPGTKHNTSGTQAYGKNGFVEYTLNNWSGFSSSTERSLGRGDASGNMALVAMDKGIWMCQYREHNVDIKRAQQQPFADNLDNYILSFIPYNSATRTWTSCETDGISYSGSEPNKTVTELAKSPWSQNNDAPLQSTPGAGIVYKKHRDKDGNMLYLDGFPQEYLYLVNHEGNIVKIRITNWNGNTPGLTYMQKLITPASTKTNITVKQNKYPDQTWNTAFITSMELDYAGNLVTITGNSMYHTSSSVATENIKHEIIVYTMPYDRTNAQEIRASNKKIYIPERMAQFKMTDEDIQAILSVHQNHSGCAVDLYRPMQGGMFNTFCVPFKLDTRQIPENNPLYGAEIRYFENATLREIGGENVLVLSFAPIDNVMDANVPYIIKPEKNIKDIISFDWAMPLAENTKVEPNTKWFDNNTNTITYQGILPLTNVKAVYEQNTNLPLRLILVADNRLAAITSTGDMYGFRGYFELSQPLPKGMKTRISTDKKTPTNTTIVVDGKKVNIEKYLREGRVYIRVGDSLYTIDGQVVE